MRAVLLRAPPPSLPSTQRAGLPQHLSHLTPTRTPSTRPARTPSAIFARRPRPPRPMPPAASTPPMHAALDPTSAPRASPLLLLLKRRVSRPEVAACRWEAQPARGISSAARTPSRRSPSVPWIYQRVQIGHRSTDVRRRRRRQRQFGGGHRSRASGARARCISNSCACSTSSRPRPVRRLRSSSSCCAHRPILPSSTTTYPRDRGRTPTTVFCLPSLPELTGPRGSRPIGGPRRGRSPAKTCCQTGCRWCASGSLSAVRQSAANRRRGEPPEEAG